MDSQEWMACAIMSIVLFGCMGNLVSFVLFSRPHMRSSSVNVLLCALSFVDFSLLLISVPTFALPGLSNVIWASESGFQYYMAVVLNYVYPVNLIMQTCSIYTMVMITTERWFAVCRPLQVRLWCTPKKSRIAVLVIFLSSIAYNFVRFFEYSFGDGEEVGYVRHLRNQTEYPVYHVGYFTALYLITHFLVPFSLLAVMNGHVIVTMWQMRKARLSLTRQQQREQSTTVMLLVVTFLFAASNTLPFLLNIAECVYPQLFEDERTAAIAFQINDLTNVLVVLNSATTFLIYLSFSEKYRETLVFIIKNGCCASSGEYNTYMTMSRTASMRVTSTGGLPLNNNSISEGGHKLSVSRSSDAFLKPLFVTKRAERSTSEYNERTKKLTKSSLLNGSEKKAKKKSSSSERPFVPSITVTASEECGDLLGDEPVVHL